MSNFAQNWDNRYYERRRYASEAKLFCWKVFFKEEKLTKLRINLM
jgi:hypothetical protein